ILRRHALIPAEIGGVGDHMIEPALAQFHRQGCQIGRHHLQRHARRIRIAPRQIRIGGLDLHPHQGQPRHPRAQAQGRHPHPAAQFQHRLPRLRRNGCRQQDRIH
ncbi:hypothetical protein RZS08_60580, partial [Arthrospira platensis SPKY1]|nr:hypothetical protein [Arthrospira platensis SPKY1]